MLRNRRGTRPIIVVWHRDPQIFQAVNRMRVESTIYSGAVAATISAMTSRRSWLAS